MMMITSPLRPPGQKITSNPPNPASEGHVGLTSAGYIIKLNVSALSDLNSLYIDVTISNSSDVL